MSKAKLLEYLDDSVACKQCGDCCRYVLLPAPKNIRHIVGLGDYADFKRFLDLHGIKIVDDKVFTIAFKVPLKCGALVESSLYDAPTGKTRCGVYDERPKLCKIWRCEK
jgi:Fe-S-cluster containining protein